MQEYRNLRFPREQLICKKFIYSNTTPNEKVLTVRSTSPNIVVKHAQVSIPGNSNATIQLRMFFGRECPDYLTP